jgi:surfactin synthase thioesterase subunit
VDGVHDLLDLPFAFFGHSMGALMAFEAARYVERPPAHLFVSGRSAPQISRASKVLHMLTDPELIEELREMGGSPDEVLNDKELMGLLLPSVRQDFKLVETYAYQAAKPLTCPVTAFGGLADAAVPLTNLQAWGEETTGPFDFQLFQGDHFFLNTDAAGLLAAIDRRLDG